MNRQAFFDACRKGVMGPTLCDVTPTNPLPNTAHRGHTNSKFSRYDRAAPFVIPERTNNFVSQLSVCIFGASLGGAVSRGVCAIGYCVTPIEIVRRVIEWVSVAVADHRLSRRGGPKERLRNKPVDLFRTWLSVPTYGNLRPSGAIDRLLKNARHSTATIRNRTTNSAHIRSFIVRGAWDYLPYFHTCNGGTKAALKQGK